VNVIQMGNTDQAILDQRKKGQGETNKRLDVTNSRLDATRLRLDALIAEQQRTNQLLQWLVRALDTATDASQ
jgi:hypothetical protein